MFIPALVLQYNNDNYINGGIAPGTVKLIPTPNNGGVIDGDYWAVPVSLGIVSAYEWVPCAPGSTDAPDPQAVHAVRISSTQNRDDFYVLGTSTQYIQASKDAECCESPAYSLPTTIADIAACQALCANDDGNQFGVFGLPSPDGGTYTANGVYNGDALPEVTGATAAALIIALNNDADWFAIGTWAKTSDDLTLTVTGAAVSDPQEPNILCVLVTF
jgi:hypothetical protein